MFERNKITTALKFTAMSVAAMALIGCSSPEEKVAKYVSKGQEYLAAGDLTKARIEFQNALRIGGLCFAQKNAHRVPSRTART